MAAISALRAGMWGSAGKGARVVIGLVGGVLAEAVADSALRPAPPIERPEISELETNPLRVNAQGAFALDAWVVLGDQS